MANARKSHITTALAPGSKRTKPRSFSRTMRFNQENVEITSHIAIGERSYGFIRATNNAATPFPNAKKTLDNSSLLTHLRLAQTQIKSGRKWHKDRKESTTQNSTDGSSGSSEHESQNDLPCKIQSKSQTSTMNFQLKRKLFDEGEYTITRGQKLSEVHHAAVVSDDMATSLKRHTHLYSLREMEDFCRKMNIKIHQGFSPGLH
ncbi:uncharacterized protein Dwil_GK18127 [Drosophila willistoni]|uniref:Uncharacterized protein n=1 Tax=Drosophila willistoni TaxID=7260 RepID=B4MZ91_DROWI|nr:uncharacterized protein Dwil_GK18127 [Drosophila willistoni]